MRVGWGKRFLAGPASGWSWLFISDEGCLTTKLRVFGRISPQPFFIPAWDIAQLSKKADPSSPPSRPGPFSPPCTLAQGPQSLLPCPAWLRGGGPALGPCPRPPRGQAWGALPADRSTPTPSPALPSEPQPMAGPGASPAPAPPPGVGSSARAGTAPPGHPVLPGVSPGLAELASRRRCRVETAPWDP